MSVGVGIAGCCGRMGRAIATLALEDSMFAVRGALEAPGHAALGQDYGTFLGLPKPLGVAVVDDAAAAMRPADVQELLTQLYIKDDGMTVQEHINQSIAKLGENIQVGRFAVFVL